MLKIADVGIWTIFQPLAGTKTLLNYFFIVEEVPSFDLVSHM